MLKLAAYCFIFLLLFACNAQSQQTRFRVTHYDETSGLQTSIIYSMLQDRKGYMWFGTANGLYRYDGYTFKSFRKNKNDKNSLQDNNVLKLAEDQDGKIWMGLFNGISSYDPSTGTFINYDVRVDSAATLRAITMLFIDKENNIWAGLRQKGLIMLNKSNGKFLHYDIVSDTSTLYSKEFKASYNNVYNMYEEGNGIYWLATHDGLYRFNNNTKTMHAEREKNYNAALIRSDLFNSVAADKNGLWLGAYAGGLSHYNFKTKEWKHFKYNTGKTNVATSNIINAISFNKDSAIWIATDDRGIGAFDTATKRFDFCSDDINTRTLVPFKFCNTFYRDKQNNLWLSFPDGLFKVQYFENRFQFIPVHVSKSTNDEFYGITAMLDDAQTNTLFIGTNFADGLHVIDKTSGKSITLPVSIMPKEENSMIVNGIIKDGDGIVWVVSRDYIYQYNVQQKKLMQIPQPPVYTKERTSNSYSNIAVDFKNNIWISSFRNGVFCYNTITKTYRHFYNNPHNKNSLPVNVIGSLVVDENNNVWVGSPRGGFGYINTAGNFIPVQQSGNQLNHVYALFKDSRQNIWAGTDDNLLCYNTKNKLQLIKTFGEENGLKGNVVSAIAEDAAGNTWCITNSALCKAATDNTVTSYGKLDGIDKINSIEDLFLLNDKSMALFTYGGYYIFNPASIQKKNENLPLVITSFKIDDKEQFFESSLQLHKQMVVPAKANVISFEYAALDFTRPDKQQYFYKLENFDKDWVNAGERRYAGYANLPGGDYIFKVKAVLPGNASSYIATIPVHIIQPFYKTWWFIIPVVVLIVAGTYFFYRSKLKGQQQLHSLESKTQLLEKEKALAMYEGLKQQLNPHFLFNSLTSLNSLINYNQKEAGNFLEGLSKIYRYILKSRDNETVTLAEEKKFIETFIRLQQTRFQKGLVININIPAEYDYSKIVPVTLQNLIENALKHNIIDEESPLTVDISIENGYIIISNNLQKKNFVETSNKQGLTNLISLYHYLTNKPVLIEETAKIFSIKIPLL